MSQLPREKLNQLSVRTYLDQTVVQVLMQALAAVSRERPEDPVSFVAQYLLSHNPKKFTDAAQPIPGVGGAQQPRSHLGIPPSMGGASPGTNTTSTPYRR